MSGVQLENEYIKGTFTVTLKWYKQPQYELLPRLQHKTTKSSGRHEEQPRGISNHNMNCSLAYNTKPRSHVDDRKNSHVYPGPSPDMFVSLCVLDLDLKCWLIDQFLVPATSPARVTR